jgi:hypothetical protein
VLSVRVLRRKFGSKRYEVTLGWGKLHNEELRVLICSPSIIRIITSMEIKWAGHVARIGKRKIYFNAVLAKPEGKKH